MAAGVGVGVKATETTTGHITFTAKGREDECMWARTQPSFSIL